MRKELYALWGPLGVLACGLLVSVFRHDFLAPALGAFVVAVFAFRLSWVGLEAGSWSRRRHVPAWARRQELTTVHRRLDWADLERHIAADAGGNWPLASLPGEPGEDRYWLQLVSGRWRGRPLLAADYEYWVRPDEGSPRRVSYTVAVVAVRADRPLPELSAVPAGPWARLGRRLRGWRGRAAYTGLPHIDARYVMRPLRGRGYVGPGGVFDSGLDVRTAQWLAGQRPVRWCSTGDTVLTWRRGYLSRGYLARRLPFLAGLAERLPAATHRYGPPGRPASAPDV